MTVSVGVGATIEVQLCLYIYADVGDNSDKNIYGHPNLRQTATNQQNRQQPTSANKIQWQQIKRAIDYGKSRGVKVTVTGVK